MINHHSKAETILKLTVHSQFLQNYFSPAKIYISQMTKFGQGVRNKGTLPMGYGDPGNPGDRILVFSQIKKERRNGRATQFFLLRF